MTKAVSMNIHGKRVEFANLGETWVKDGDYLLFGDGSDVTVTWDATDLHVAVAANNTVLNIGDGTLSADIKVFGSAAANYMEWDASANALEFTNAQITLTDSPIQQTSDGTGYSYNLIAVTSTTASGNTRGWRVNTTTTASMTHGDLQCIHGYLTMGATNTLATGAAIYPLSAWLDLPSTTVMGSGNVIAGLRVIFDGNGLDMGDTTALIGGGESALIYAQTWAGVATKIFHGLRIVAGASTTIRNMLSLGGSGTVDRIIDLTEWPTTDRMCKIIEGGPTDSTATANWVFCVGDASSHATIVAELGGTSHGSLYASTAGKLWVNESGTWTSQT